MLSEQDNELISALLDGELSTEQSTELKARLLREPELNELYQAQKQLDEQLKAAFSDTGNEPMPDALADLLAPDPADSQATQVAAPATLPTQAANDEAPGNRWGFMAVAACLAMVTVFSFFGYQSGEVDPLQGLVAQHLESTSAMTPVQLNEDTRFLVMQSFVDRNDRVCREYLVQQTGQKIHSVACRVKGAWQLQVTERTDTAAQGEHYQTATGETPEMGKIDKYLNKVSRSEPMAPELEATVMQGGWVKPDKS